MTADQERRESAGRVLSLVMACATDEHKSTPVAEVVGNGIAYEMDEELWALASNASEVLAQASEDDEDLDDEMARSLLAAMCYRDLFLVCAAQMQSSAHLVGAMGGEAISEAAERVAVFLMGRMNYQSIGRVWAWVLSHSQDSESEPTSAS